MEPALDDFEKAYKRLKQKIDDLEDENLYVKGQNEDLKEDNENLRNLNQCLTVKNKRLISDKLKLGEDLSELWYENQELKAEIEDLKEEPDTQTEIRVLKKRLRELEDMGEDGEARAAKRERLLNSPSSDTLRER